MPVVTDPTFTYTGEPSLRDLDLFTDANGVLLQNHVSSIGNAWTKIAPADVVLTIQANALLQTLDVGAKSGGYRLNFPMPSADYTVSAKIRENAAAAHNSAVGVIGRMPLANQSGYSAEIILTNPATVRLARLDAAGTPIVLAGPTAIGLDPRAVTPVKISLRMTGTLIEALVNDAVLLSVVDAVVAAAGFPGLRFGNPSAGSTQAQVEDMRALFTPLTATIPQAATACYT